VSYAIYVTVRRRRHRRPGLRAGGRPPAASYLLGDSITPILHPSSAATSSRWGVGLLPLPLRAAGAGRPLRAGRDPGRARGRLGHRGAVPGLRGRRRTSGSCSTDWSAPPGSWSGSRSRCCCACSAHRLAFRELVAQVLSLGLRRGAGRLAAVPAAAGPRGLGLIRTSLLVGLANAGGGTVVHVDLPGASLAAPGFLRAFRRGRPCWCWAAARRAAEWITTWSEDRLLRRRDHPWPAPHPTSGSSLNARRRRPADCFLNGHPAVSPRATSTGTTRRSCTRRWPRIQHPGACWCWAAATALAVREIVKYPAVEAGDPGRSRRRR